MEYKKMFMVVYRNLGEEQGRIGSITSGIFTQEEVDEMQKNPNCWIYSVRDFY